MLTQPFIFALLFAANPQAAGDDSIVSANAGFELTGSVVVRAAEAPSTGSGFSLSGRVTVAVTADNDDAQELDQDECDEIAVATGAQPVDVDRLAALLDSWGSCQASCPFDLNHDLQVDAEDLMRMVGSWADR